MSVRQTLAHAARNLRRRPLRNVLAGLGVALATGTLVALLGLSRGLQLQVLDRASEQQPLLTLVQVFRASAPAGGTARPLDDAALAAIQRLPSVRSAFPVIVVPASLRLRQGGIGGTALGMTPEGRAPYALRTGRAPEPGESSVAVLTSVSLGSLGLTAENAVGAAIEVELRRGDTRSERRTLSFRVVGVADDLPGQIAVLPLADAEDAVAWIATGESDDARALRLAQQAAAALIFGGRVVTSELAGSRYTGIWAFADSPAHLRDVVRGAEGLGFSAFSRSALDQTVEDLFRAVNATLAAISAVALLVAMLGVVNSLVTTVSERTAEIGVLKALGAHDATVERLFLAEATLLGLIGGAVGTFVGAVIALIGAAFGRQLAGGSVRLEPMVDAPLVTVAMLVAVLISLVGGWVPARRAARLVPADALRSE